jgi:DDE superfamily endonuclease
MKAALAASIRSLAAGCLKAEEPPSKSKSSENTPMLFVPFALCREKAIALFHCNTGGMNELLGGLSETYPNQEILVFADSAGWHKSKELDRPANIHLELLPPYSPELNPTEHLWDYIGEQKAFNNHVFDSMDQLEDHLEEILKSLHNEKNYIQSLCTFH